MAISRIRLALTGALVALTASTLTASAASAAVEYEWHVGGAKLIAGSTREFTIKDQSGGIIALSSTVAGAALLLLSNKIKVTGGAKIIGGLPGTGEEVVEFENAKIDKPKGCQISGGVVKTKPLKIEIVESAEGGKGTGKVEILFAPKTGTVIDEFEFRNNGTETCFLNGVTASISGSGLTSISPEKKEATSGVEKSEPTNHEYKTSAGTFHTVSLIFAGEPATGSGAIEASLVSGELAGVF